MPARIADVSEVLLELGEIGVVTDQKRALANIALKRAEAAVRRHLHYDPAQETRTEYYPRMDQRNTQTMGVWEADATQAYFRSYNNLSSDNLQLRHLPVRSITNCYVDFDGRFGAKSGSFPASSEITEGTDFWPSYTMVDSSGNSVCEDGLIKSIGRWPAVPGSVKIIYVSGYTDAELHGDDEVIDASPIHETVVSEAVRRFKKVWSRRKNLLAGHVAGPLTSERLGDYSYSVDAKTLEKLVGGTSDLEDDSLERLQQYINYGYLMG